MKALSIRRIAAFAAACLLSGIAAAQQSDARVTLPAEQLEALFDLGYHTKHVDTVFARVFGAA